MSDITETGSQLFKHIAQRTAAAVLAASIGIGVGVALDEATQPRDTVQKAMFISHMKITIEH